MDSRSTAHRIASGDVVVHAKFGTGTVVAVDLNMTTSAAGGEGAKVTVRFEKAGEKSVLSSFLKLEREVHRIDSLREAVHAFGRTSVETTNLLTRFGRDLLVSLKTYLTARSALFTAFVQVANGKQILTIAMLPLASMTARFYLLIPSTLVLGFASAIFAMTARYGYGSW